MKLVHRSLAHHSARVDLWPGGSNVVRLQGVMREENVGDWILPLIDEIHGSAVETRLAEVVLDIRGLEYANAALWRSLVRWVKRLRDDAEATYNLRIVSDPTRTWQQVGGATLRAFSANARGAERLVVEEVGA